MADVDLAAIRARHAEMLRLNDEFRRLLGGGSVVEAEEHQRAVDRVAAHLAGDDVPALLAAVDRVRAMCAFLTDRPALGADTAADLVLAALENRAPEEAGRV